MFQVAQMEPLYRRSLAHINLGYAAYWYFAFAALTVDSVLKL